MNPNSANQRWSKWIWFVAPGTITARPFKNVVENVARFARKGFGSASQMRIRETPKGYIVEVLSEGHPAHDPQFVKYMKDCFQKFFINGFGPDTQVRLTVKLMAGSRQDGTPADQMVVLPSLRVN